MLELIVSAGHHLIRL